MQCRKGLMTFVGVRRRLNECGDATTFDPSMWIAELAIMYL
jgi:hypothetical protein